VVRECIVCGGRQAQPLYNGILRCRKCSYVFADLQLSNEEFRSLYRSRYFFGAEYSNYLADKRVLQKNFRLRLQVARRFLDPTRHRRLFEIGCAYGFFLEVARELFTSVQGIDVTADGVRYASTELNLDVIHADLLEYDLGMARFDVVAMWDTIEHLRSPHLYVEKIARHMDSGALLAITTGDIESLNARWQQEQWRLLHPPTHAHYFSWTTLPKMLSKYGFEVIYQRYCGFYRSLDNVLYNIVVLRHQRPGVYNVLKKSGLTKMSFYLNLYDIMYVIARKR
jgi:SAM-dependent methyltransferase